MSKPGTNSGCSMDSSIQIQEMSYKGHLECGNTIIPANLYLSKLFILVSTDAFEKEDFSPYYFRVRPILLGDRSHIVEINSDKETEVETQQNSIHHYMIPLYSWDGTSNIIVHANTNNDETNDIIFYAKKVSSEDFDK